MISNVVQIDSQKCNGCGLCTRTCPELVLERGAAPNRLAQVAKPGLCIGCMACEEDCPTRAIRVFRLPDQATMDDVPAPGLGLDPQILYDLVVVGAGPAGLTAAIRARLLGFDRGRCGPTSIAQTGSPSRRRHAGRGQRHLRTVASE